MAEYYYVLLLLLLLLLSLTIIIKLLKLVKLIIFYYYKFHYGLMLSVFLLMCRRTSQDNKMAAFCKSYSNLYELRSLAPNVPVVALTVTASKQTRDTVFNLLNMKNAVEIKESPNKLTVAYVVQYMDKEWKWNPILAGLLMN